MVINVNRFNQLTTNMFTSGMHEKLNIETKRKIVIMNVCAIASVLALVPLGILAFIQGNPTLCLFDNIIATLAAFIFFYLRKGGNHQIACYSCISSATIFFFYLFVTGGVNKTAYVWYYTFPLFSSFLLGSKKGAIATVFSFSLAMLWFLIDDKYPHLAVYSFDLKIRFIPSFLMVFLFSYVFENIREKTQQKLSINNIELNNTIIMLKETDRKLRNAQEELEKRVEERTAELLKTNIQLKNEIKIREHTEQERHRLEAQLMQAQKMEAIGTLAGGVAHDLNNILIGLVSYPDLLLMELPDDSPLREPLLTIQKSGERAAATVQDLLTLARRGVAINEILNLNNIISEYLKSPEYNKLKSYYPNIQLDIHLEKNLLNIKGSPVHLLKTFMNLVTNAAEAMPAGGKLNIATENQYIDRVIKGDDDITEGDYAIIKFTDTGIGIPVEDIGKIFEPFYTKKNLGRSGTGLGMAVVWGTVKDHNGYIDVQSSEGVGTTFKLYFPVTRMEIPDKQIHLSIDDYIGNGEAILIVDDIKEQRDIASALLKRIGYSVVSVSSGEESIEYMQHHSVDILVLDMIMDPGIDGLETYQEIVALHPGQRAIIVSGYSESEKVIKAQKLGAGIYIKKPYLLNTIARAIKAELNK